MTDTNAAAPTAATDFIRAIVADDLRSGKHDTVVTRFPPEPNGYLHIGHATSVVLNFGIALENGGRCHLRFDDTNPETEDVRYVQSIADVVRWLGYDWGEHLYFASDYFETMYEFAIFLIRQGKAYVDDGSEDEIREARGSVTEPGRPTPSRGRSVEESLELFARMRAGEFPDGAMVLRAKIDLAASNMLLRDPLLYRIRHAHHYRTGDRWCIYPLYDYAHPLEDAIEEVTHSLCTLEFENNRAIYDWVVDGWQDFVRSRGGEPARPRQIEFARRNFDYTVVSKRKLLQLVNEGHVRGWDDPRMPTLAGLRRRGFTPESIRAFCERIGVARAENRVDIGKLEHAIRDDLNQKAPRVLCVLRRLKIVITNYPEGDGEVFDAPSFPHDVPKEGSRPLPFSRELYIERDDFAEDPPKGFHRLSPGREVRLRYAYLITCQEVVKDATGGVLELRCTYDPETRGGNAPDGRQVKGTIHWVSAAHGVPCEVRLYDRLFSVPDPDAAENFKSTLNPRSVEMITDAIVEPSVLRDSPGSHYQFERLGYFYRDPVDSRPGAPVFNRTVTLRDAWAKAAEPKAQPAKSKPGPRAVEPATHRRPGAGAPEPAAPELDAEAAAFVEAAVGAGASERTALSWLTHELPRVAGDRALAELPFDGAAFGRLIALVDDGTVSTAAAREVLAELAESGGDPPEVVERRGLRQVSDPDALAPAVDAVIAANAAKVAEYRAGKTGLLGFFVGHVLRGIGGSANPEIVRDLVLRRLDG